MLEREQEAGEGSSVLKVSLVGTSGKETPIREVTWAFHDLDEDQEMWVGMAVAKPTVGGDEELLVDFDGFELELRD